MTGRTGDALKRLPVLGNYTGEKLNDKQDLEGLMIGSPIGNLPGLVSI